MKNIDDFIKNNNFTLNREIKNYLLQSLSNDRMISKLELEKIEVLTAHYNTKIAELVKKEVPEEKK